MDINIKLDKDFSNQFDRLIKEYGEDLARLNGFGEKQLDYTEFIDNFIDSKVVADASIDGNANVGHKDIVTLENEMSKPHSKLLAFNKIFYELKKKYGFQTAKQWLEDEWVGKFYLHDSNSSSFRSYCFAYDLTKLAKEGLFFIKNFNNLPPKHLNTFTDFVGEYVSWACNRSSGAVGLPNFLVYSFYFWKKDCESGYTSNPEQLRDQEFQRIIFKLNQPFLRQGIQSAFTNFSIFDRPYFEALFGAKEFPDGSFMIDFEEEIIEYQKAFMKIVSEVRSQNLMTFPVISFSLLKKDNKFVDEDFAKWCCKHNMEWYDSNFFISDSVTSLSNCCRLKSDIKQMGFFNSIGGSALSVGSVKVNTINLARIAYEAKDENDYLKILKKRTISCIKTLDVIRHIIIRNVEKGLLPNYGEGLIDIKSQYNTVGIIGLYEAVDKFGLIKKDEFGNAFYTEEGVEFGKKILKTITETKTPFEEKEGYRINIEAVPGESAAAKLMQKDKMFYPNEKYELPLYGNQWIPLGVKCTMQEKVKVSAILDQSCSGGAISHYNIASPIKDFDTMWNLLNYISDAGVTYFAFNPKISACKHNHGFFGEVCPVCGEPKETSYTRIVGFLVPEKTFSKERKAEFALRRWEELNK